MILAGEKSKEKRLLNQISVETNKEKLDQLHEGLRSLVINEESASQIKELCLFYANRALRSLDLFPDSEAKQALVNIANSCTVQQG